MEKKSTTEFNIRDYVDKYFDKETYQNIGEAEALFSYNFNKVTNECATSFFYYYKKVKNLELKYKDKDNKYVHNPERKINHTIDICYYNTSASALMCHPFSSKEFIQIIKRLSDVFVIIEGFVYTCEDWRAYKIYMDYFNNIKSAKKPKLKKAKAAAQPKNRLPLLGLQ